jgi:hypothetical protein
VIVEKKPIGNLKLSGFTAFQTFSKTIPKIHKTGQSWREQNADYRAAWIWLPENLVTIFAIQSDRSRKNFEKALGQGVFFAIA